MGGAGMPFGSRFFRGQFKGALLVLCLLFIGLISAKCDPPPFDFIYLGPSSGTPGGDPLVSNNVQSNVTTFGSGSYGALAQSIGGGGGVAHSGSQSLFSVNGTLSLLPIAADLNLGVNVSNSANLNGGSVTINHGAPGQSATTTTAGDWSHGLVAQSIGAGGGKASTIFGTTTPAVGNLAFTMGANNGKGNAGTVTMNLYGSVGTGTMTRSDRGQRLRLRRGFSHRARQRRPLVNAGSERHLPARHHRHPGTLRIGARLYWPGRDPCPQLQEERASLCVPFSPCDTAGRL